MSALPENSAVSSILLRSGKGGPCRVFIVQTRNGAEVNQVQQLFDQLQDYCSVRRLSSGVTTAYAVQSVEELPILEELEAVLKEHYKFSVVYAGFNPVIHRIVEDLAVDTGSRLYPIPTCRSCGDAEPFPTEMTLRGPGRRARAKAQFCDRCLAEVSEEEEAEGLCRLMDDSDLELASDHKTPVVHRRGFFRKGLRRSRQQEEPPAPARVSEPIHIEIPERLAS